MSLYFIQFLPQNLFVEKIREYGDKKAKSGGKLVDATKASEADLQNELDKVINKCNILFFLIL